MIEREREPDRLSLHPAWLQIRAAHGRLFYIHSMTGECSAAFHAAPRAETCGGILADEVGLGKSLQLLGLVVGNRAPAGWAAEELPRFTREHVPVRATLVVAPAAIL